VSEAENAVAKYQIRESRLLEEHNKLFAKLENERAKSVQTKNDLNALTSALGEITRQL
jgi:hypothetical protein